VTLAQAAISAMNTETGEVQGFMYDAFQKASGGELLPAVSPSLSLAVGQLLPAVHGGWDIKQAKKA
jgi:hypothetical protein